MKTAFATIALSALAGTSFATVVHIPVSAKVGGPFMNGDGLNGTGYFGSVNDLPWARMKASGTPNFTFMGTNLNYTDNLNGGNNPAHTTINEFLAPNGGMVSNGAGTRAFGQTVYKFSGFISIKDPGQYDFDVLSDDGFELRIGGQTVSKFESDRGPGVTGGWANFAMAGTYSFELLYWNNNGPGNLAVTWNRPNGLGAALPGAGTISGMSGKVVPVSVLAKIPAPSAAATLALAGMVAARRRRA
jgi:hypothetical protein